MTVKTSLIAYWSLEESSGTRVDAEGSNDLADNNTVLQGTGKVGSCADFEDATSESLSITDNTDMSTGDVDYSFICWVKFESLSGNDFLLAKDDVSLQREYGLYKNASDIFTVEVFNGADGLVGTDTASTFGAVIVDTWYFVYAFHNSVANTVGISVNDGTVDSSATSGATGDSTSQFELGARNVALFLDGLLDEVGFWKKVLTSSEVTWLYNGGSGRAYSDLNMTQIVAGSIADTGSLVKDTRKVVAGSITNTGNAAKLMTLARTIFGGSIANTGSLIRQTNKIVAGAITNTGALTKFINLARQFSGSITPTGALTTMKAVLQKFYTWTASFRASDREDPYHAGSDEKRGRA